MDETRTTFPTPCVDCARATLWALCTACTVTLAMRDADESGEPYAGPADLEVTLF